MQVYYVQKGRSAFFKGRRREEGDRIEAEPGAVQNLIDAGVLVPKRPHIKPGPLPPPVHERSPVEQDILRALSDLQGRIGQLEKAVADLQKKGAKVTRKRGGSREKADAKAGGAQASKTAEPPEEKKEEE